MSTLLVQVFKIEELGKHPDADTLFITRCEGWQCIVKDGEFKIGDLAVYIPIDSVVPDDIVDKYQLSYLKNGARIRTVKLRGFISQGLVLPINCLPSETDFKVGDNVAELLGITKWEPPAQKGVQGVPSKKKKRIANPLFFKYTDIENIKNYTKVFKPGDLICVTEKVHGQNARFSKLPVCADKWWKRIIKFFKPYEYLVGSHEAQLDPESINQWNEISKIYKLDKIVPNNAILFGEIYGKVQDLTYGLPDGLDIVFFDMMQDGEYVDFSEFYAFCVIHNLPTVPLLYIGYNKEGLLESLVSGDSVLAEKRNVKQIREGIVIKSVNEETDPRIGRKILKFVSNEYYLRKNGTEFH